MTENAKDIAERLARLEEKTSLKFAEMEKALVLARELVDKERIDTKSTLEYRLAGMNEFQKRMDKLEGTFVTKENLTIYKDQTAKDIANISRLVYIGIGVVMAIQFLFRYVIFNE